MTTAVDVNDVLMGFQTEIGTLTQRAVLAEVGSKKMELENQRLTEDNERLRQELNQLIVATALAGGEIDKPALTAPEQEPEVPATFKGKPKPDTKQ